MVMPGSAHKGTQGAVLGCFPAASVVLVPSPAHT